MTQNEMAQHLGMSSRNLRDVLKTLGFPSRGVNIDTLRLRYIEHLRSLASGRATETATAKATGATTAGGVPSIGLEKALLTRAQRELAEHHLAVAKGKFIALDDMKTDAFEMFRRVRDRMQGIPVRVSNELAGASDPRAIEAVLDGEIRAALVELSTGAA
ncbi:MAG: hypothetical protein HQL87_07670 [Magnetococcales bacterium]|nr:hypothetical protein [Magnetococcales bacterium]